MTETVAGRCSVKKMFLNILQNSQENTCVRFSSLIKLQACGLQLYWKGDSDTGVFLWIFETYENTFFIEHLRSFCIEVLKFAWKRTQYMLLHLQLSFYLSLLSSSKHTKNWDVIRKYAFSYVSARFDVFTPPCFYWFAPTLW